MCSIISLFIFHAYKYYIQKQRNFQALRATLPLAIVQKNAAIFIARMSFRLAVALFDDKRMRAIKIAAIFWRIAKCKQALTAFQQINKYYVTISIV